MTRALTAFYAAEVEEAERQLRELAAAFAPEAPPGLKATIHAHLGIIHFAWGRRDSATAHFRAVVTHDPFFALDTLTHHPDLVSAFRAARRGTVVLGLQLPADTVMAPETDSWPVSVAVGRASRVVLRLLRVEPPDGATLETVVDVDSTGMFAVNLAPSDTLPPLTGRYELLAWLEDVPETDTVTARIRIDRIPVDTLPHERRPGPDLFRPEAAKGPPPLSSLLKGVLFGAAAGAIPMLLQNDEMGIASFDPRAVAVGASITLGGVVGLSTGRPDVPIAENIEFNRNLREEWDERIRATIEENEHRRRWAPLRVRQVQER